jgi:hypothetical protein
MADHSKKTIAQFSAFQQHEHHEHNHHSKCAYRSENWGYTVSNEGERAFGSIDNLDLGGFALWSCAGRPAYLGKVVN